MWPVRQSAGGVVPPAYPLVEENLRAMMRFFSLARPSGTVEERNGLQLVSSGIDFSPFNSAMLAEPVRGLAISAFESRVKWAEEFFRARKERWSFWLCEDMLPPHLRQQAKNILIAKRMRQTSEPPGMVADIIASPNRKLPDDLEILPVRDAKSRADFGGITACTFDLPHSICREVYHQERSWSETMQGWVGYVRNEPIATCAAVVTPGAIGIYTVGTMPHYRKRGYSELLMRNVLAETIRSTGITRSILQATPSGYPMYHKMGYRKACQFAIFLSEH